MEDITPIIALINLIAAIIVIGLLTTGMDKFKGSLLFYAIILFFFQSIIFVVHTGIEVFALGEDLYALSALIGSTFMFLAVFFADKAVKNL